MVVTGNAMTISGVGVGARQSWFRISASGREVRVCGRIGLLLAGAF